MRYLLPALIAGLLLFAASPAAAEDELGLSLDGKNWTSATDRPLLDPVVRWVPGDTRTASFWTRNQSDDPARLTIDLIEGANDTLVATGDFVVTARATGRAEASVSRDGRIITLRTVQGGEKKRVNLAFALAPTSGNASQDRRADLTFRVTLTQAGTGTGDDAAESNATASDRNGVLPDTGAGYLRLFAIIAAILIGAGLALLRTRDQRTSQHV